MVTPQREELELLTVMRLKASQSAASSILSCTAPKLLGSLRPVASGDEDIIDRARANELRMATGAWCIAWEGSGAMWVAVFNQLRFVELRSITDRADADAVTGFRDNLQRAMPNISQRLIR
jgi:hypothetical protein